MTGRHRTELAGLVEGSLADYLCALGILRAVAIQRDGDAALEWAEGVPWLACSLDGQELAEWLARSFAPSAVVSPWNAGSGLGATGTSKEAEKALAQVEASSDPRFAELREAISAGRAVVAEGRRRGWGGGSLWADQHKPSVLALCRNRLPESVLAWLDTVLALQEHEVFYNPLVGTGGNFGRQDLSATYLQHLLLALGPKSTRATCLGWAHDLVTGGEQERYVRGTVGQFDPGRAGGIHSSPFGKQDDKGFVNPWRTVLTCEGLMLFASAVTRRSSSRPGQASPFVVRSTPVGYSTTSDEKVKGEVWAPLWQAPARLPELVQLFGEGRARFRGRQARNGFDFARAAGSLGVDRGLDSFRRFVFTERLGQNPLAVHAGDISVGGRSTQMSLTGEAADWVENLRGDLPNHVHSLVRRTQTSLFALAAGTSDTTAELVTFIRLFGRLHESVARSSRCREKVRPFQQRERAVWTVPAGQAPAELQFAAALAALRSGRDAALRPLLTRTRRNTAGSMRWSEKTGTGAGLQGPTLAPALAAVHQHRLRAITEHDRGADTAFAYPTAPGDTAVDPVVLEDFLHGALDDHLTAELLQGLITLGWHTTIAAPRQDTSAEPAPVLVPALATLLPFYGSKVEPVWSRWRDEERPFRPVLRPRPTWATQLRAGQVTTVLRDAGLRMRHQHCHPLTTPTGPGGHAADGIRLAAALLAPVTRRQRTLALTAVSATDIFVPSPTPTATPEETTP